MAINNGETSRLKREILVRLIRAFLSDSFEENVRLIPYDMRPKGSEVPYRCCIYKERAILKDRTIAGLGLAIEEKDDSDLLSSLAKQAMQREKPEEHPLTVLETACKGCVPSRIYVTDLCQGCVARPCVNTCKFGAITVKDGKSKIDPAKCKNCGMCAQACPYQAISRIIVPCENACPVGAIEKDENGHARIDFDKCITCGKCVAACPFGAVHEKSQVIDVLKRMKEGKKVVAMIAPAIVGQLPCSAEQLHEAIKKIGFSKVYEVAQGADITAKTEVKDFLERIERGDEFMTTSCCAGYNELIDKHLPEIKPFVSDTKTPLYYTAEIAKKEDPDCVTVFMSPCVAKRSEGLKNDNVDYVLNFEELGALLIAMKIEVLELEGEKYEVESSSQARNFAVTGGVAESVVAAAGSFGHEVHPYAINGLDKKSIREIKNYAKKGKCELGNLIEVMCCEGGCIGGSSTINAPKIAKKQLDKYCGEGKPINSEFNHDDGNNDKVWLGG